jgi:uncharacterized surface protein with fasciclin (FAS1) repeats
MKRTLLKFAAAATVVALVSACGGDDDPAPTPTPTGNIAQVATGSGLTALVAAATKAELADELSAATASLTVFAPTNAAFDALAKQLGFADATAMVTALPKEALASILSYHVLGSKKSAADLTSGGATQDTIYTFDGAPAKLKLKTTGGVTITDAVLTDAKVTTADVAATNGVVHVIDKVLVPPGVLNVVQMAQANPAFSSLVSAVVSANLVNALSGAGPLTVFAPTNAAFAAAPANLTPAQPGTVLTYHVVGSQVLSSALPAAGSPAAVLPTLATPQTISVSGGTAPVIATIADTTTTPATITAVDVRASNGVIHVIDKVLIPTL